MAMADTLEGLMLVCFSVSWYWSIAKMLRTRTAAGKSLIFAFLIFLGYFLGIISKFLAWEQTGALSPLIWIYCWNVLLLSVDAALLIRFSRQAPVLAATPLRRVAVALSRLSRLVQAPVNPPEPASNDANIG